MYFEKFLQILSFIYLMLEKVEKYEVIVINKEFKGRRSCINFFLC